MQSAAYYYTRLPSLAAGRDEEGAATPAMTSDLFAATITGVKRKVELGCVWDRSALPTST
jgi:hypothetical protein